MIPTLALFMWLALLGACSPVEPEVEIRVSVERTALNDWRVTYQSDTPLSGWAFARSGDDYRRTHWRAEDGVTIVRQDGLDWIQTTIPRTSLSFEISSANHPRLLDNQAFLQLGGAGLAVYTGQLFIAPSPDVGDDLDIPGHAFRFSSGFDEQILVHGQLSAPEQRHAFKPELGAYVIFGALADRRAEASGPGADIFVADALPERMPGLLSDTLNRSIEALSRGLAHELDAAPTLILTERHGVEDGFGFRGGVVQHQVAVEIGGPMLFLEDAQTRASIDSFVTRLMTHEAVHLWNGDLVTNADPNEAWLHEGSAELLSWFALYRRGFMDWDDVEYRISGALNDCVGELGQGPLSSAMDRGRYRAFYGCGAVMNLVAAEHAASTDPVDSAFALWSDLIGRGLSRNDRLYGYEDFAAAYLAEGGDIRVLEALTDIRQTTLSRPGQFLSGQLELAGWRVEERDDRYQARRAEPVDQYEAN